MRTEGSGNPLWRNPEVARLRCSGARAAHVASVAGREGEVSAEGGGLPGGRDARRLRRSGTEAFCLAFATLLGLRCPPPSLLRAFLRWLHWPPSPKALKRVFPSKSRNRLSGLNLRAV